MIDHEDAAEAAAILLKLLDAVDRGEITATENEYSQLRGAVIALQGAASLSRYS